MGGGIIGCTHILHVGGMLAFITGDRHFEAPVQSPYYLT